MSVPPSPAEIYDRAVEEGRRRLSMPPLEQVATGFIAGVTIVFGIVALGVVEALVKPVAGPGIARIAGALAFAIGVVFLVVGRTELFSENFFDPVAAVIGAGRAAAYVALIRLWGTILVLNLVGGAVLTLVLTIDGALPESAPETLIGAAERIATKQWAATLARAVMAGALLTMLSYLLAATDSVTARVSVSYMVGFLLALGPFDHVVVSALHLVFGLWLGGPIGYGDLLQNLGLSTAGNLAGGLLLITLTHTAQVKGR
ncbi:MAG: formate/nitrite transporter family protein [Acidimicrobiia bacterium]